MASFIITYPSAHEETGPGIASFDVYPAPPSFRPASRSYEMIRKLFLAGADAFRVNMSHGAHEDHAQSIAAIRQLEKELNRPTTILADLQGPKLRVGTFADGAAIRIYNHRGEMRCRAQVTDRVPAGTVWMRDGWTGLNNLTSGAAVLPDEAVETFGFSAGQAAFDAAVEVAPA